MHTFGISPFLSVAYSDRSRGKNGKKGNKKGVASNFLVDLCEFFVNLLLLPVYLVIGFISIAAGVVSILIALVLLAPFILLIIALL